MGWVCLCLCVWGGGSRSHDQLLWGLFHAFIYRGGERGPKGQERRHVAHTNITATLFAAIGLKPWCPMEHDRKGVETGPGAARPDRGPLSCCQARGNKPMFTSTIKAG